MLLLTSSFTFADFAIFLVIAALYIIPGRIADWRAQERAEHEAIERERRSEAAIGQHQA